jgi:PfaB family protein
MTEFSPIAIIGQGCVLPGALSPEALWTLVQEGRSALSLPTAEDWRLAADVDRAKLAAEAGHPAGGYVRGFESVFDPSGFAVDVRGLDPVFQWTLHASREALRSARLDDAPQPRGVVVLGNLSYPVPELVELALDTWQAKGASAPEARDARNRFMSGLPAALTAQALRFGLGGFALDAACASSLYAIRLACDRLHDGSADVALAGGVNHADSLFLHLGFTALAASSKTGQSRPFHRDADGLVPAHGAAMVVLRRLEDAVRDGAPILGVIRGVGLSNDGRGRGLLVPMESGQTRAMREAYAMSGLLPRDVSLVECHATGTVVGDGTELRSMRAVFDGVRDLPIGSLKSNLGHSITASGAAGLLKVLAAMKAKIRPATLHVEAPLPELANGPIRLLHAAEPWPSDGPRRAAISNFGFGGNNAHLIVEEWTGRSEDAPSHVPAARANPDAAIAVVAQSVITGTAVGSAQFARVLFDANAPHGLRADPFELDVARLRIPPADLDACLPQQTLFLRAALDLDSTLQKLPPARTSLFVGMQCDAEVARCSLPWRLPGRTHASGPNDPALTPAQVLGCMPNIVANRMGSLFDFQGPSFTLSGEEASGVLALQLAARALRAGEVDAAVVGAVDLCCEPVHSASIRAVTGEAQTAAALPTDAAVVLVLKRLHDAERDGDAVLATVEASAEQGPSVRLPRRLGHAHAASGLLHVAAAIAACEARALPAEDDQAAGPLLPDGGTRWVRATTNALGGLTSTTTVRCATRARAGLAHADTTRMAVFAADSIASLTRALETGQSSPHGTYRAAIVAADDRELAERIARTAAWLPTYDGTRTSPFEGVYLGAAATPGELSFVFTGPAGAYPGMGAELAVAFPELVDALGARMRSLRRAAGWVYEGGASYVAEPVEKLWGSSLLIQMHAELTRGLLGMRPSAAIGYCSGETNALFAMGAWDNLDGFRDDIDLQGVYTRELSGEMRCVREAWRTEKVDWATLRIRARVDDVRAALAGETRAYLTIINSPTDVVIAGETSACARVASKVGAHRARSIAYDFVMHCPEARRYAEAWHALHHRPTKPVPGVRFYTHSTLSSYAADAAACADALTGQAMNLVDFPAMVERAWADGVRVFVEHGPHGGCTKWISEVLGDREHVAVALDRYGRSSTLEAAEAVARLFAAGVPMDVSAFVSRLSPARRMAASAATTPKIPKQLPAHFPPVEVRPPQSHVTLQTLATPVPAAPPPAGDIRRTDAMSEPENAQLMTPAPKLPILFMQAATPAAAHPTQGAATPNHEPEPELLPGLVALHHAYLQQQSAAHQEFLRMFSQLPAGTVPTQAMRATGAAAALPLPSAPPAPPRGASAPPAPVAARPPMNVREVRTEKPAAPQAAAPQATTPQAAAPQVAAPQPTAAIAATATSSPRVVGPRPPTGPAFTRAQLEVLASGTISKVFGPLFEQQDRFERQVRMPEPPLLLADRVLGIEGEPGTMGTGCIWTETDVTEDAWYLHQGRMPAGILVESGQADLLLISWLGVDFLNRGERVYRLLGCELTAHGELPKIGDTLHYEIHVDGHANQGDVRLFFFHYDCWVNGEKRVSVRNGQAGFFTTEELANSAGVLWSADEAKPTPIERAQLSPPRARCKKARFTAADLDALIAGDGYTCFGEGFERLASHTLTPSIQGGRMRLLDEVTQFDPEGGPWKRGYMRARLALKPDHWFFDGHFKNDPCMPGTLMFEGCFQALAIYVAALGYTMDADGWRFEPVPEAAYQLRCRGQALPTSTEVIYEVFVDEIVDGETPTLYADLLGTVDGLKAFHCKRMGIRLVPAWPMDKGRLAADSTANTPHSPGPIARAGEFAFDYRSLMACALGRPSEAFGELYTRFDGTRRVARLPGPPYHFMSRVARVEGPCGGMTLGSLAEVIYDVPPDAWYFTAGPRPVMPFAVLLEVALQPCGWLASYIGSACSVDEDLVFRNLDGSGTVHREITPDVGSISTTTTLTSLSTAGGLIIVGFDVNVTCAAGPVYTFKTVFGFFPPETMKNQVGLPTPPEVAARLTEPSDVEIDLRARPAAYFSGSLSLPGEPLLMIDRVTGLWPEGGKATLGRIRAEKRVDPREWFFKAHFFQDPVQPGSLGIEALIQALQALMIAKGLGSELSSPVFEPIASETPMTWKYRGQVVPETPRVVVELELTRVETDARGCVAYADGSLWAGDKRVYEVRGLAMRVTSQPTPPVGPSSRSKAGGFDRERAKHFWRDVTGVKAPWAGEDLLFGLLDAFVGKVHLADAEAIAARRGKGAIYLANHQVAVETILAAIVLGGVTGSVPTLPAKAEHQHTWVGQLTALLNTRPGIHDPRLLRFIDREDPSSVLRLRDDLAGELRSGRSVLVHVEGTRATSCREPVRTMSSVFLDLAVDGGIDVIPVRFVGGLPVEPTASRLELPVGYGQQDYWIGRPISARELAGMPFAARTKHVLAAINGLGVTPEQERPTHANAELARDIAAWRSTHRVSETQAAMAVALQRLRDPSDEGRALLAELQGEPSAASQTAMDAWRARLGAWLLGRA